MYTFQNNTRVLDRVLRRTQEKKLDSCDIKNMLMESFNYVTIPKTYSKKSWYGFGAPTYYAKNEFISYEMLDIDIKNDCEEFTAWKKRYRDSAVILHIGDLNIAIIDRRVHAAENRASLAENERKRKEKYAAYTSLPDKGTSAEELELRMTLQTPWFYSISSEDMYSPNSLSDYAVLSGTGNIIGCKNYEVLENHLIEVVSDYMVEFKLNTIRNQSLKSLAERYLIYFK